MPQRASHPRRTSVLVACLLAAHPAIADTATPALPNDSTAALVRIRHPLEGAVMPHNLPAPRVSWETGTATGTIWSLRIQSGARQWDYPDVQEPWEPPATDWQAMKESSQGGPIALTIAPAAAPGSGATVRFQISPDRVDHPLFYREVILPFNEAVKDPSKIRWRFGSITAGTRPPVVLENLPVCGNCHSFSGDGRTLAMDVDYANSKGSYIMTRTGRDMRLATSDIITWDDYRKEDGQQTYGLLSQISPDGRYAVSTVKDRSVFVPRPDLAFSQLFFPLQGILAVYDRESRQYAALPGADDTNLVQSNPAWSPDGQWIAFARNKASQLERPADGNRVLLTPEECEEFLKRGKEFRYDLYRVPFHGGKGGTAEPIRGASANGRSNFFPKYSPDGRWIVFCQASNYMLLQPDSELFIVPAAGGEARRLGCNLSRMNSWHSWSPDGRWLVFSSKAHSDYTQLYLSRISDHGEASPPVWLAHMVDPGRAANIPEFVSLPPDAIGRIQAQFLDDYSYTRAGNEFFRAGDIEPAIEKYQQALAINPDNAMAHQRMGFLLFNARKKPEEAEKHLLRAVQLDPANAFARFDLGRLLATTGRRTEADPHLAEAVRLMPDGYDRHYTAVDLRYALAENRYHLARYPECIPLLRDVLQRDPSHARGHFLLAMALAWQGETQSTRPHYDSALKLDPSMARLPDYFDLLSRNYLDQGLLPEAEQAATQGLRLALDAGRAAQAARLRERIQLCRQSRH